MRPHPLTLIVKTNLVAEPVFDGLIAAAGRLFVFLADGRVECLGRKR